LNLDETDNRPSLATVIETAEWYVTSKDRGAQIVAEVIGETRHWRQVALHTAISRADIELTAAAFVETDGYSQHLSAVHSNVEPARLEPSIEDMEAQGAAKWTNRQRHRSVSSPSPADDADHPTRSDELTKDPDSSIDDDLEL
jgi:hypothetical protein